MQFKVVLFYSKKALGVKHDQLGLIEIEISSKVTSSVQQHKRAVSNKSNRVNQPYAKAMITLCDLLTAILFKLAHSCLNAFNLIQ